MTDTHDRVRAAAAARGLDIDIRERPEARSLEQAAALLGIEPGDIVKTLVVKRKPGADGAGEYLFVLVPGGRAISWPKLRALLDVNRLSMPDKDVAMQVTGYERGTITPFGASTAWPVVADASLTGDARRRISLGAGAHGVAATVPAEAALVHLAAQIADVTEVQGG